MESRATGKRTCRKSLLITPADPSIFFETPCEERWAKAAKLLGIDIHSLAGYAGHA